MRTRLMPKPLERTTPMLRASTARAYRRTGFVTVSRGAAGAGHSKICVLGRAEQPEDGTGESRQLAGDRATPFRGAGRGGGGALVPARSGPVGLRAVGDQPADRIPGAADRRTADRTLPGTQAGRADRGG